MLLAHYKELMPVTKIREKKTECFLKECKKAFFKSKIK